MQKQDELELAEIQGIKAMDDKVLAVYKKDPAAAREMLSAFCENQAGHVVDAWWDFAWELIARYDDGFVNAPGKMAQDVGYPREWYKKTGWADGPTTYAKPVAQ